MVLLSLLSFGNRFEKFQSTEATQKEKGSHECRELLIYVLPTQELGDYYKEISMDVATDTSVGSKSATPLPFDVDVQTATITDVLSKAVGVSCKILSSLMMTKAEVVWSIDEPFTPDEVSEAIQVLQKSSKLDGEVSFITNFLIYKALRLLDSVYLSVIVEFLLQNTSHQARFSFMTNLVEYFAKNNTPFELNAIATELLSKPSLDDEIFWNFLVSR